MEFRWPRVRVVGKLNLARNSAINYAVCLFLLPRSDRKQQNTERPLHKER